MNARAALLLVALSGCAEGTTSILIELDAPGSSQVSTLQLFTETMGRGGGPLSFGGASPTLPGELVVLVADESVDVNLSATAETMGGAIGAGAIVRTEAHRQVRAALSLTSAGTFSGTLRADKPIAYYRFGEPMGAAVPVDAVGGLAAAYVQPVETGVPGLVRRSTDRAVAFKGDGHVTTPVNVPAGDFSLEVLVARADANPAEIEGLFSAEVYLLSGFRVGVSRAGGVQMWTGESGGEGNFDPELAGPVVAGSIHHVVVVRTGTRAIIYVDGQVFGDGVVPITATAEPIVLGYVNSWPLAGTFDEAAIYDRALSAADVGRHHAAFLAGR